MGVTKCRLEEVRNLLPIDYASSKYTYIELTVWEITGGIIWRGMKILLNLQKVEIFSKPTSYIYCNAPSTYIFINVLHPIHYFMDASLLL